MQLDLFSSNELQEINAGFLEAAAWADSPDNGPELEPNKTAKQYAKSLISGFLGKHGKTARPFIDIHGPALFGHNLWLTIQGHGAGFLDHDCTGSKKLDEIIDAARYYIEKNGPNVKSLYTDFIPGRKYFGLEGNADQYGLNIAFLHGHSIAKDGTKNSFWTRSTVAKRVLMDHHKNGLTWTASGYGAKIPTEWMIKNPFTGRYTRVYCAIYSNIGSTYIIYDGKKTRVQIEV